jgi:hypothetical protein
LSKVAPTNACVLIVGEKETDKKLIARGIHRLSGRTVSRTLTELRHRGAITFSGTHRLRIVDRSALEEGKDAAASCWPVRSNESSISAAQAQSDTHRAKVPIKAKSSASESLR